MKKGWETNKLGEVCEIGAGNSAPQKKELFDGGRYQFFRTSDVGRIHFGVIEDSTDKLNETGIKKLHFYKKGTLLFPKSGASTFLNHRVLMATDGYVSSHLATLKAKDNILDDRFLLYFSSTVDSRNLMQDQNYPSLRLSDIQEINILLPPLPEQKRIVSILDKAFAAISTAKANAEKNLANAHELFESYLQGADGKKESLGTLVDIRTGKLNANAATENGKYPFFTCSREVFAIDKFAFDCEAILLAGNNAVGDFNVKHYKGRFNAYQRTYVITVNKENRVLYRYLYFQMLKSLKEFKSKSVGAGTKFLKLGMIKDLQIALPSVMEQTAIVAKLDELSAETKKLEAIYQQKIADLEELKKSVLQKAFAGELSERKI